MRIFGLTLLGAYMLIASYVLILCLVASKRIPKQ